ncbi:MAG: phosphatidate cytidylyltransferase [Oscillospiraceae bacterium]|nr:phosphatidate cytidylyltransferase [Candidatus Ruminococcus equi]
MKKRIISAVVGIALCILILIFGEMNSIVVSLAVSVINALCVYELLSAAKLQEKLLLFISSIAFAFLAPLFSYSNVLFIVVLVYILFTFGVMVFCHKSIKPNEVFYTFCGTLLLSISFTSLTYTACKDNRYTAFWCVLILAVPWLADSAAYFVGSFMGKTKLCPEISPKKTVEGAVGGVLGGIAASMLVGLIFMLIYREATVNFIALLIIGVVNSVLSILGDLTFSVNKRYWEIKDYGSIMPGHGGALDRFDSVIFCSIFVFTLSQFMTIIS